MKFTSITCPNCGGALTERNGVYSCTFCFTEFRENQLSAQEVFLKTLDAAKQEALASARRMLYDAVHAEDVSSERVIEGARGVKKYAPDDFSANFYEAACDSDARTVNNFLDGVDVAKQSKFLLTGVCEFMLRSLEKRNIGPLKDFLERAHLAGVFTGGEYTDYLTRTEKEAEKLDNGVYNADLPRDVFLAYSSRDMAEVNALADYLEGEGLRCFVAARNLRHGKGAAENYRRLLETAMRNCKSVVFVSTEHSRDLGCDALAVELPYLREHRGDIYRVEYRPASDSGRTTTGAKILLEAFFEDLEYARTREDVLARLVKHKYGLDKAASSKEEEKQKEEEAAKKRAEEEARNRELAEMSEKLAQMEWERREEQARMDAERRAKEEAESKKKQEEEARLAAAQRDHFEIDKEKCIGCGMCSKRCPVSAILQTDYIAPGHKFASYKINSEQCTGCGVCQKVCNRLFNAVKKCKETV